MLTVPFGCGSQTEVISRLDTMAEEDWPDWQGYPKQSARFKGQRMITGLCTRHKRGGCTHPRCSVLPGYQSSDSEADNTDLDEFIKKNELRPNESKDQQIERLTEELAQANERKAKFEAGKTNFEFKEDSVDQMVTESYPLPEETVSETPGAPTSGFQRLQVAETQAEESDDDDRLSAREGTSGPVECTTKGETTPVPHEDDDEDYNEWGSSWGPKKTTTAASSALTVLANSEDTHTVSVPTAGSSVSSKWWTRGDAASKPAGRDDFERVWQWYGGKWHHNRKW